MIWSSGILHSVVQKTGISVWEGLLPPPQDIKVIFMGKMVHDVRNGEQEVGV